MDKLERIARRIITIENWNGDEADFEEWYYKAIDELFKEANNSLSSMNLPFDYSIEYDETFETCKDEIDDGLQNCIGIAMFSNQYDSNVLPIAIDSEQVLLAYYDSWNPQKVKDELEITVWHEIGHGLLSRFKDEFNECGANKNKEFNAFFKDEEKIAEDFGKAKGDLNNSDFGKWIVKNAKNEWKVIYG